MTGPSDPLGMSIPRLLALTLVVGLAGCSTRLPVRWEDERTLAPVVASIDPLLRVWGVCVQMCGVPLLALTDEGRLRVWAHGEPDEVELEPATARRLLDALPGLAADPTPCDVMCHGPVQLVVNGCLPDGRAVQVALREDAPHEQDTPFRRLVRALHREAFLVRGGATGD